jgi:hypothetical protein
MPAMTALTSQQKQLITLMATPYEDIRELETTLMLTVGKGDMRVRIEYFHDAVRALTSGSHLHEKEGRLSIEQLAYDLAAIRYLQAKPLSGMDGKHMHQSPSTAVVTKKSKALSASRAPTREDKQALSELYLRYGLLFAALFKPFADRNTRDRIEELDELVAELAHEPHTKEQIKKLDKQIAAIEKAQLDFGTAQLGLYEEGKDVVKQLAADGLNLAGQFVANASAKDNTRGRGR